MDDRRFDDLTRRFATGSSRRTLLKGVLGLGGAAVATFVGGNGSQAAWSTLVCLPSGEGYIKRLVPTAAVPLYRLRYGAVLPENGLCPIEVGNGQTCPSSTLPCDTQPIVCGEECVCLTTTAGEHVCVSSGFVCSEQESTCTVDIDCVSRYGPDYVCVSTAGCDTSPCGGNGNACSAPCLDSSA